MKLYIDDDSVDPALIRLLRRDGHDIQAPADVGLAGSSDQVHLAHAIRNQRAVLTRNYRDFEALHDLVALAANGHHEASWSFASTTIRGTTCRRETSPGPCAIWKPLVSPSPTRTTN